MSGNLPTPGVPTPRLPTSGLLTPGVPASGAASVVICPNGPILVRGDFDILTPSGEPVPRQRKTVALCRCGASAIKPFCDGTHKMINFRTENPAPQDGTSSS